MTNQGDTDLNCECQYTLTLTDQIVRGNFSVMKDSFNHVPNIHEVVEDDTDEEYLYNEGSSSSPRNNEAINKTEEESDSRNEATYRKIPEISAKDKYTDHSDEESCDHRTEKTTEVIARNTEHRDAELDNDDSYTNESFYSDESYDEYEENVKPEEDSAKANDPSTETRLPPTYKLQDSCRTPESGISEGESREEAEELGNTPASLQIANRGTVKSSRSNPRMSKARRKNMSFTDEQVRRIERENQLLLRKIMAQQRPKDKVFQENARRTKTSSSAINRKKLQRQIEYDNMLMLQRIQQAKSCVMNIATKPGYRLTFV